MFQFQFCFFITHRITKIVSLLAVLIFIGWTSWINVRGGVLVYLSHNIFKIHESPSFIPLSNGTKPLLSDVPVVAQSSATTAILSQPTTAPALGMNATISSAGVDRRFSKTEADQSHGERTALSLATAVDDTETTLGSSPGGSNDSSVPGQQQSVVRNRLDTEDKTKWFGLLKGVKQELIGMGKPNDYWYHRDRDNTTTEINSTPAGIKVIYGATKSYIMTWEDMFEFRGCEYNNCIVTSSLSLKSVEHADVVLYYFREIQRYPDLDWRQRSQQYWVLYSDESAGYGFNQFQPSLDNIFNATMTFRPDSDVPYPYGQTVLNVTSPEINYATGKTKGAFAYVTNCESVGYNRMKTMLRLGKYIDVDIFGACTKNVPCDRSDWQCERRLHSKYRFYLSFENSLCKDYITEKFWSRLQSDGHFVPVALGGTAVSDYTRVAPPDSFLHLYNFTSIRHLGEYLEHLKADDDAYNSYHKWRTNYQVETFGYMSSCKLCELANSKSYMPAKSNLSSWWNDNSQCHVSSNIRSRLL